jgi:hypothetical protein
MIETKHSWTRHTAVRWGFVGLVLLAGAATAHAWRPGPLQACVAEQTKLLLSSTHEYVPERAGFAAELWCVRNNNRPGHKRFN